nr:Chain B, Nuclear receptor coactivator 1 [Homo sapiens]4DQM_D Chain D, Nuclear receptor coactivator 1 [Homo sapiens]4Y29_B Chain B, Peptide from Nuclear receptor coactivator 1 [Homo sapiens]5L7E_B Chain B, NCOA1 peptide [Homo sapiens]5L7G_B Chain B, NCOA1 peptide [Homo sapiens]5L7H_B Chain B, NCOA1 peptide [Homo sapiens]
KSLLQQLLTE